MLAINNLRTAGEFFLIISGELILIFIAVSFLIGVLMEYLPPSRIRELDDFICLALFQLDFLSPFFYL